MGRFSSLGYWNVSHAPGRFVLFLSGLISHGRHEEVKLARGWEWAPSLWGESRWLEERQVSQPTTAALWNRKKKEKKKAKKKNSPGVLKRLQQAHPKLFYPLQAQPISSRLQPDSHTFIQGNILGSGCTEPASKPRPHCFPSHKISSSADGSGPPALAIFLFPHKRPVHSLSI